MDKIVEQFVGGGGGLFGGIFGEAREAVLGGCWGILMSGVFFFFFFLAGIAMFWGITNAPFGFQVTGSASPFIVGLCISGLLSPAMGILFGLQTGFYRVSRHIIFFLIYLAAILAGLIAASIYL